jgi:SAM-dependent methyltransferase
MILKEILYSMYNKSVELNHRNIFSLFEDNINSNFLDLGCDDGILTKKLAKKINTANIYGVEIVDERIRIAENNKIIVKKFDLNEKFDFNDSFFDVIHANQVIEHLYNSDNFISEIYRILKPGGYAVISTENASSWCNIFASIMGWQIFSLTNISLKKLGIGNPLSFYRNNSTKLESWNHIRIYNIRGLKEYFEVFGFKIDKIMGSGYFPFPAAIGNIDKTHCHFMTFKIKKTYD